MVEIRAESSPPVCITGMHRSGTSSMAQLLHWCGVHLGPQDDLFTAGPANPDGYWENGKFVEINNRILDAYRGGWDLLPSFERSWYESELLAPVRAEAESVVRQFEYREPWGWKDPRNSLTMPFWTNLLPEIKVVVCLRNPLEVALSLRKRGNSSMAFGLNLWEIYNRRLLDALSEDRYIVTHYEAYFYRPQEELRRVLDFLGLRASDQLISHARSSSLKGLRHHRVTPEESRDAEASWPRVFELYTRLCQRAEWDPERPAALGRAVVRDAAAGASPG